MNEIGNVEYGAGAVIVPLSPRLGQRRTESEALVVEANHRIANNLSVIVSLVRMHAAAMSGESRSLSGEDARLMLLEVAARIETVGRLHKLLSMEPSSHMVDAGPFLEEIATALVSSLAVPGTVELSCECSSGCLMSREQIVPLGLVVNEIVTNAVKYAHPSGVAGTIGIDCRREPDGTLFIEVADDGVGLPDGFDPAADGGIGFRVVRSLSQQLGAQHAFESGGIGLRFQIRIPAEAHGSGAMPESA
jgi:two-component sensor histidine kinase